MKKTTLFSSVALLGVLATSAQATLIDFNSLAEGTIVSNQFAGVTFAGGTGGLTVPFSVDGTGAWDEATILAVSSTDIGGGVTAPMGGMILHRFSDWLLNETDDAVFVMTFDNAITDISIDFGGIVDSISAPDSRILAYKTGSTTADYSIGATTSGTVSLSLLGMTDVTKVVVTPGNFGDWVGVDNINYTPAATVPEPASLAVLGLGGLALLRRRNKK